MSENNIYQFSAKAINGENVSLSAFKDKVMLIVNVASKCGFTSQYKGLEQLHKDLGAKGLSILGFPCNQFGGQEPGSEEEIKGFCDMNYGVTFPLFSKVEVNGDDATALYDYLKSKAPGIMGSKAVKWNFTKFLVDRNGQVTKRFAPKDKPEDIRSEIEKIL